MRTRRRTAAAPCVVVAALGVLALGGCATGAPAAPTTVTQTVTAPPSILEFNPATSGKVLAARIAASAKAKRPADKIGAVSCANFPDLKVGTHTDCHLTINGAKVGVRATFTERDGHYVLTRIPS
ncbi:DUF4333 domain-containing protein [Terracoccus sp. 273MFTsu3.1]|uniref:DUF4333 domain-containing protein n=1 Tax=Terracoccus sp. 273MFTsu3.1 TaxID=1172188 RepID=UPI0009DC4981|nr:DUF4333 domain-containing protein [Terracoccus sp. 273MFTsu3.1]